MRARTRCCSRRTLSANSALFATRRTTGLARRGDTTSTSSENTACRCRRFLKSLRGSTSRSSAPCTVPCWTATSRPIFPSTTPGANTRRRARALSLPTPACTATPRRRLTPSKRSWRAGEKRRSSPTSRAATSPKPSKTPSAMTRRCLPRPLLTAASSP